MDCLFDKSKRLVEQERRMKSSRTILPEKMDADEFIREMERLDPDTIDAVVNRMKEQVRQIELVHAAALRRAAAERYARNTDWMIFAAIVACVIYIQVLGLPGWWGYGAFIALSAYLGYRLEKTDPSQGTEEQGFFTSACSMGILLALLTFIICGAIAGIQMLVQGVVK